MSIADLFRKGKQKNLSSSSSLFSFLNSNVPPRMTEKEFLMAYRGWVYACINAIADEVANVELKLQKVNNSGEWTDVQMSPALDVLHNSNPFWSLSDLLFATAAFLELHGNAFWYTPRNGNNDPSEIWVLDPSRTWVVKSESEYIGGYVFQNDKGVKVPLEVSEIIHFKRFNPMNPFRGMGTVEAAALAIDIDTFAANFQRNFFGNAALPSGVLSAEGTLSQDQYDRIRVNWDVNFKGVDNAGKMAILEGGLKFQSMMVTQKDMEFLQGRQASRDEILGIFRVPKSILGITEDVNRANAETSEYVFAKRVVKPRIQFIVSKLNEFFLEKFGIDQTKYRLTFLDPVPENQQMAMDQTASALQNSYMTINEARAKINLDPIKGADELFVSTLMQPMSKALAGEEAEPDDDVADDANENEEDDNTKAVKKKSNQKDFDKRAYLDKKISKQTKVIEKLLGKLKTQLLNNLKNKKSIKPSQDTRGLLHRLKTTIEESELIRVTFDNYSTWIGLLFDGTKDDISEIYKTGGKQALLQLGLDQLFDLANPRAISFLQNHALEQATQVGATIKDEISQRLVNGLAAGASMDDLAASISQYFDEGQEWRAMRIARTETAAAYSQGSLEGYKQSSVVKGTYWLADAEACPICESNAAAGTITLGDAFPSGVTAPPGHPNCECDIVPVNK